MCQFVVEAQRIRNRQSEAQFDGVVACGDLALQPFQAGERVGSGPVLIGSPWGDQVGAQVQVLLWSRGGTIRICRLRSAEVSWAIMSSSCQSRSILEKLPMGLSTRKYRDAVRSFARRSAWRKSAIS